MKKKLAFSLGVSSAFSFAGGNVALALRRYMPNTDFDIIISYTHLPKNAIDAFAKIPNCRLNKFSFPDEFKLEWLSKVPQEGRFRSPDDMLTFCRFEAFSFLNEYEHVIALDADLSIQSDVSSITQYGPFGITTDAPWTVQMGFTNPIEGYDMTVPGVNAAVISLSDKLPYMDIHNWCYRTALRYASSITTADQSVLNLMLQEFRITPNLMPLEDWQCIAWRDQASTAKIVHFGTSNKVWNTTNIFNAFPEWYRVHCEWLKLGGGDFDRSKIRVINVLSALNIFDPSGKQASS